MATTSPAKRATVYLDPMLHRALKIKALETSRSISDLINESVRFSLEEDRLDLAAFEERVAEPVVSFEEVLKELKKHGRI
ncbi:CopG family transcriptional regulator [Geobacter benzoatilyticus]|uniref:CopG family transcriptional regulator n=1 Tax=Geobacter benzoatilyticus TaxID=2815309 RepID=A0ABX7Q059_9BACT|nr:CopG family transcriptional regulator [Geobacter benzoatilyticus]QSV44540.1 CopG family transcriptional regulator [Geobacter benzoatilyticus]